MDSFLSPDTGIGSDTIHFKLKNPTQQGPCWGGDGLSSSLGWPQGGACEWEMMMVTGLEPACHVGQHNPTRLFGLSSVAVISWVLTYIPFPPTPSPFVGSPWGGG